MSQFQTRIMTTFVVVALAVGVAVWFISSPQADVAFSTAESLQVTRKLEMPDRAALEAVQSDTESVRGAELPGTVGRGQSSTAAVDGQSSEFDLKYAGMTVTELATARTLLRNRLAEQLEASFADRRRQGLFHRITMLGSGPVPVPIEVQAIPKSDRFLQSILNPPEEITPSRSPEDPMPVWWIMLHRPEYPDLFLLNDEITWLSGKIPNQP